MENHQIRTRAELQNRRSKKFSSKLSSDEAKKSLKITKKSVKSASTYVDKDTLVDFSSYTFNGTPALEMSEDNQETGSIENLLPGDVDNQLLPASPQAFVTTDLTPSSVITTNDSEELFVLDGDAISEASKGEAEVDMVINYLKHPTGKDLRLEKLRDALIEVMETLFTIVHHQLDMLHRQALVSKKMVLEKHKIEELKKKIVRLEMEQGKRVETLLITVLNPGRPFQSRFEFVLSDGSTNNVKHRRSKTIKKPNRVNRE